MNTSQRIPNLERYRSSILVVAIGMLIASSCVSIKEATYLQEYVDSEYSGEYVPPEEYIVQYTDNLYIRVSTPDPRWSEIFNAASGGDRGLTDAAIQVTSYPVQPDGRIELPYIGFIEVAGKTFHQVKMDIEEVLVDYIKDASITVRLVNNFVTVLGEVRAPGMYPIIKERLNIFQALALAGDIDDFGNRYNVKIIRKTSTGSTVEEFDITDRNIVDSEFYYIMPNDVLYVEAKKGRYFAVNAVPFNLIFGTLTATISILILIQNSVIIRQ